MGDISTIPPVAKAAAKMFVDIPDRTDMSIAFFGGVEKEL